MDTLRAARVKVKICDPQTIKLNVSVQHCVVTGFGQSGAPAKSFVTSMVRSLLGRESTERGRSFSLMILTILAREVMKSSCVMKNVKVRISQNS